MTTTLDDGTPRKEKPEPSAKVTAAAELVRWRPVADRPDGLLKQLTKAVLETASNEEIPSTSAMPNTIRLVPGRATCATAAGRRRC